MIVFVAVFDITVPTVKGAPAIGKAAAITNVVIGFTLRRNSEAWLSVTYPPTAVSWVEITPLAVAEST